MEKGHMLYLIKYLNLKYLLIHIYDQNISDYGLTTTIIKTNY